MLPYAIAAITSALIFYTVGVWSEKIQKVLKPWHLAVFWTGFVFDTIGTTLMSRIAGEVFQLNLHGITGLLAIALMLFHAVWASIVLAKNNEQARAKFHKFSLVVWIIWLIPYLTGLVMGMMG